MGPSYSIKQKMIVLHVASLGLVPGTIYGSSRWSGVSRAKSKSRALCCPSSKKEQKCTFLKWLQKKYGGLLSGLGGYQDFTQKCLGDLSSARAEPREACVCQVYIPIPCAISLTLNNTCYALHILTEF